MDMKKKCVPCHLTGEPLKGVQIHEAMDNLGGEWEALENHRLHKAYHFKNFKEALIFTNEIGEIAEIEGHHPIITLKWGEVIVDLFTHAINGLSMNDFILAEKIETIYLARFSKNLS